MDRPIHFATRLDINFQKLMRHGYNTKWVEPEIAKDMSVIVNLACSRVRKEDHAAAAPKNLMTPGDLVTKDTGFLRLNIFHHPLNLSILHMFA